MDSPFESPMLPYPFGEPEEFDPSLYSPTGLSLDDDNMLNQPAVSDCNLKRVSHPQPVDEAGSEYLFFPVEPGSQPLPVYKPVARKRMVREPTPVRIPPKPQLQVAAHLIKPAFGFRNGARRIADEKSVDAVKKNEICQPGPSKDAEVPSTSQQEGSSSDTQATTSSQPVETVEQSAVLLEQTPALSHPIRPTKTIDHLMSFFGFSHLPQHVRDGNQFALLAHALVGCSDAQIRKKFQQADSGMLFTATKKLDLSEAIAEMEVSSSDEDEDTVVDDKKLEICASNLEAIIMGKRPLEASAQKERCGMKSKAKKAKKMSPSPPARRTKNARKGRPAGKLFSDGLVRRAPTADGEIGEKRAAILNNLNKKPGKSDTQMVRKAKGHLTEDSSLRIGIKRKRTAVDSDEDGSDGSGLSPDPDNHYKPSKGKFICAELHCRQILTRKRNMLEHIKRHIEDGEFDCDHCTYSCPTAGALNMHVRCVHQNCHDSVVSKEEKPSEKEEIVTDKRMDAVKMLLTAEFITGHFGTNDNAGTDLQLLKNVVRKDVQKLDKSVVEGGLKTHKVNPAAMPKPKPVRQELKKQKLPAKPLPNKNKKEPKKPVPTLDRMGKNSDSGVGALSVYSGESDSMRAEAESESGAVRDGLPDQSTKKGRLASLINMLSFRRVKRPVDAGVSKRMMDFASVGSAADMSDVATKKDGRKGRSTSPDSVFSEPAVDCVSDYSHVKRPMFPGWMEKLDKQSDV